ncbi:uncharacterized protein PAC_17636 [Phialocephala subalpina]|uniref:Heterokaryon incompatibility domain-containing protein n=1 Tax=Phialocephala subalpina TaxID=576137 RepID=A0A1L7XS18_9HELO|nr:uncharacterized protein PAC_17636 [Phialocephala subalpina]
MKDVYANALLNISADDASDSTVGLIPRSRDLVAGRPVHESSIYASRKFAQIDSSGLSHEPRSSDISADSVLNTRAWVLQERMLSPRILHFQAYELAFECDTHIKCECTINLRPANRRPFRIIRYGESDPEEAEIHGHNLMTSNIWGIVVYNYTGLVLTYESDILNAISGLAQELASHLSKNNVAGLEQRNYPGVSCGDLLDHPQRLGDEKGTFHRGLGHLYMDQRSSCLTWKSPTPTTMGCQASHCILKDSPTTGSRSKKINCQYLPITDFRDSNRCMMFVSGQMIKVPLKHDVFDFAQREAAFDAHLKPYLSHNSNGSSVFESQTYLNIDVREEDELTGDVCYLLFVAFGTNIFFSVLNAVGTNSVSNSVRPYYGG